jgi:hypothetical protein
MTGASQGDGVPARDAEAGGSAPAAPDPPDDAAETLAREVYWAGDGVGRVGASTASLREELEAFAYQLRADQHQTVPVGEAFLGSAAGWKRSLKRSLWRLTRFSTKRYDRLLAELAGMNGELAQRLADTEEELARLRRDLEDRGGDRS